MLLLLAAACAAVDPVARQAEFIDHLVSRGRELLKDAPPSTIRQAGMAISKIANTFPDSTFAAVANAALERVSSAPTLTLAELHKYAVNGHLVSVVRARSLAHVRSLMTEAARPLARAWRRRLQDDPDDEFKTEVRQIMGADSSLHLPPNSHSTPSASTSTATHLI